MFGSRSLLHSLFLRCTTVGILMPAMLASAAPPGWWYSGPQPVIESSTLLAPVENRGVANIGQGKWMAKKALDALHEVLPAVADLVELDLVGPGKPIPSWDAPATPAEKQAQRSPLLLGQLKAIAAPFYLRLHEVAPQWVASEFSRYGLPGTGTFPWTVSLADDSNRSPAVTGQLKAVFSLDFSGDHEAQPDGLPDLWEWTVANHSSTDDWTNISQINRGNVARALKDSGSPDTIPGDQDKDGIPDQEDADPLDPAITWLKSPVNNYAILSLPELPEYYEVSKVGDGGQVLAVGDPDGYHPPGLLYYQDYPGGPYHGIPDTTDFPIGSKVLLPASGSWVDQPQSSGSQSATHFYGAGTGLAGDGSLVGWAYIGKAAKTPGIYSGTVRWPFSEGSYQSANKLWTAGPEYTGMREVDFWTLPGNDEAIDNQLAMFDGPAFGIPIVNSRGDVIGHPWWSGGEGSIDPIYYPKDGTPEALDLHYYGGVEDWRDGQYLLSGGGDIIWSGYLHDYSGSNPDVLLNEVRISGKSTEDLEEPLSPVKALGRIKGRTTEPAVPDTVVIVSPEGIKTKKDADDAAWLTPAAPTAPSPMIAGQGISADGTILSDDGASIWRNGRFSTLDSYADGGWSNVKGVNISEGGLILAKGTLGEASFKPAVLLPLQVVSRDKFLAGTFRIPESWTNLEVEFQGPDENLGKYGSLTGGGATKVYDKVEDILTQSDVDAGGQPDSQKVWFVKDATDPRRIHFYTCFNSTGDVHLRFYLNGAEAGSAKHVLTGAQDFADIITYVDNWVKGVGFDFGGGSGPPAIAARGMGTAEAGEGDTLHNLTRAALIPFFDVVNQVEGLTAIVIGLFDGVKNGLVDDWNLLVLIKDGLVAAGGWAIDKVEAELNKWKANPQKRAAELMQGLQKVCEEWVLKPLQQLQDDLSTWQGIKKRTWAAWDSLKDTGEKTWAFTKKAWSSTWESLTDWVEDFNDRMMEGAEKAHWDSAPWSMDKLKAEENEVIRGFCYSFGYIFGYLTEQVAVGILTDGVGEVAAILTKGGIKAVELFAVRRVVPVVARLQIFKKWMVGAAISVELRIAVEHGLAKAAEIPISAVLKDSVAEVLERSLARVGFDRAKFSLGKFLEEALKIFEIRRLIETVGKEEMVWYDLAYWFKFMDSTATAESAKGWLQTYKRLLRFDGDAFTNNFSKDLLDIFKIETSADGRQNLKEALEDLASVMEAHPDAKYPRVKVPRPSELYEEMYCVKGSTSKISRNNPELILDYVKRERKLPPKPHGADLSAGPQGHYVGPGKFDTPEITKSKYQIDSMWSDGEVRFTLDPQSMDGNTCLCYSADKENLVVSDRLEPRTHDWKKDSVTGAALEGGGVQMLVETAVVTKIEVWQNGEWVVVPFN